LPISQSWAKMEFVCLLSAVGMPLKLKTH